IALQIAGRPHPLGAEIGITDVAGERERSGRCRDFEPLDAEAMGVAGEAADYTIAESMIAVEEDHPTLFDRIVEPTEVILVQRRKYPAVLGHPAGAVTAKDLFPAFVFVELHEDACIGKCVEVSRMIEMQMCQHERVDVGGSNAVAGEDFIAADEILE